MRLQVGNVSSELSSRTDLTTKRFENATEHFEAHKFDPLFYFMGGTLLIIQEENDFEINSVPPEYFSGL